jgi:subtilase family serine protease
MTLLTTPTAAQQSALQQLLVQQQDPTSPRYHKWLTPEQWADRFGLSQSDISKITVWLKSQGFTVGSVARGRNWITFSGTAAQVKRAFGTEIHAYDVGGEKHVANASAPKIPSAFAGIITGIRGLNDFHLRPRAIRRNYAARPYYNSSNFGDLFAPGDVATVYDISPLYNSNPAIDGTGQKLAIIGQTDVYLADISDFRTGFGLSAITCTTNSSGVISACSDPHFQYVFVGDQTTTDPLVPLSGDLSEADLDLEWSGAIARNAQLLYVNAPAVFNGSGGLVSGGVWDAWYWAVDHSLAPVISLSYGFCEFDDNNIIDPNTGLAGADEIELQKANSLGITFVNSSGDGGAAECDSSSTLNTNNLATQGVAVGYPASSPEVTGVGGSGILLADLNSGANAATYWGTGNGTDGGSVLAPPAGPGYIPEQGWNDDDEINQFCIQNPSNLFCTQGGNPAQPGWVPITSQAAAQEDIGPSSGGGGASNCAKQNSTFSACVSGFPKPSWQTVTVPGQISVRFSPDISLVASPNFPGYIFCTELSELNVNGTGSSCNPGGATGISNALNLTDTSGNLTGSIIGGTSASAPIFAGIVTLLNQYLAGPSSPGLGQINGNLYALAKTPANKAFHPINSSNNQVYCVANTPNTQPVSLQCPAGGVLGFLASNADATTGYNLVTGLGSVDVDKLALAWAAGRTNTTLTVAASPTQINLGQSTTFTATLSSASAQGNVSFFNNGSTTALGTVAFTKSSNGVVTFSTTALPAGTDNVTASYAGDGSNNASTTATAATVTVTQPDFSLASNPTTATVVAGHNSSAITVKITPINGYSQSTTLSCSGQPTGASCSFSPNPMPAGTTTSTLTIATNASMATGAAPQFNVSATNGGTVTHTSPFTLTVNPTDQSFTLTPGATSYQVTPGGTVTGASATVTLNPANGFNTANSPVSYTCSEPATLTESTCNITPNPPGATTPGASFVITTTAPSAARLQPINRATRIFYAAMMPGLLGIMFLAGSRTRSTRAMRLLGLILMLGVSTLWMASCSGTNSGTSNPGTPAGAYTITVNATTGGTNALTAQTTFTLNVQ